MATDDTSPAESGYGNAYLDSLIIGNKWVGTVNWSLQSSSGQTWSDAEHDAFVAAFKQFSDVSGLTFAEDTTNTVVNINEFETTGATWNDPPGRTTLADHNPVGQGPGDDVTVGRYNTTHSSWSYLTPGGMGFSTIVHELGHAMGLDHPHDGAELFPGVSRGAAFGDLGDNNLNQAIFSVMSYNRGWTTRPDAATTPALTDRMGHATGLMAFDIAAIQTLYGINWSTRSGDDLYTLASANGDGVGWTCIWDGGGIDTISSAGVAASCTIDLTAAPLTGANAGGLVSYVTGILGGFTIANKAVIENAIGGAGADKLTGNAADNVLEGGAQADVIDGGAGSDTASYRSSQFGVDVDLGRQGTRPPSGGDAQGDTLISIENLIGSNHNDRLVGLTGVGGSRLDGLDGDDTLFGGEDRDVLRGGAGADRLVGNGGDDVLHGQDSNFIRNGGFEVVSGVVPDANGYAVHSPIEGWGNFRPGGIELFVSGGAAGSSSSGAYGVDLESNQANTNASITQAVQGLEEGAGYWLGFDVRKVSAAANAKLEVYWGGEKLSFPGDAAFAEPGTEWYTYWIHVTGGAGEAGDKDRLTFTEIGGGDAHGTLLDNVRLYRDPGNGLPANTNDPLRDGDDIFEPGAGADTVYGHGGNDRAIFEEVGPGDDHFDGGAGVDTLVMNWSGATTGISYSGLYTTNSASIGVAESYIAGGKRLFFKEVERFELTGGEGGDRLNGGALADKLVGNGGNDTLYGGGGGDDINGGGGFDRAVVKLSGNGANTIVLKNLQNGGTVTLSDGTKLTSIEAIDLEAGDGADFLDVRGTVANPDNRAPNDPAYPTAYTEFSGLGGNDTLAVDLATSGGGGTFATPGAHFDGGAGSGDLLIMDWSAAVNNIFRDNDGSYKSFWYTATTENHSSIQLFFTASFVNVERFELTGGRGDDSLFGAAGSDLLNGGTGNDALSFGAGLDTLVLNWSTLDSGAGVNTGVQTGTLLAGYDGYFDLSNSSAHSVTFTGAERFDLTLTIRDDVVTTGDGDDVVRGNAGNDHLVTRKGADTIDGGEGADRWTADKSAMTASLDLDLTRTAVQATYAIGGKTATVRGIEALGNGDADRFQSGSGSDVIITRSEQYDDQIATNAGADTVKVAGGNDVVDLGTNAAGSVDTLIVDYAHLNSGAGVNTGIQTGTLADGYGGYFDLGNSSAHSVGFAGAERFDLTLTVWDDVVTTGDGDDVVRGNGGNDYLVTRKGADTIDGGEGADTWAADKSAMTAALDLDLTRTAVQATYVIGGKTATVRGIEDLGNGDTDRFQSGSGNDVIITRSEQYDDQIATNAGADTVKVAGGNDVVDLGSNAAGTVDTLIVDYSHLNSGAGVSGSVAREGSLATGYSGVFDLENSSAHSVGFAGAERFDLTLTIHGDSIRTGDGDDIVRGNAGNDVLRTGKGYDVVDGGAQLDGTRGVDTWTADKSAATVGMTIDLTALTSTYEIGGRTATVSNIEVLGLGDEGWPTTQRFLSGSGNDVITTRSEGYDDRIGTGLGSDTVKVGGGNDDVELGAGLDTLALDWSHLDSGAGVNTGVQTGTLAAGYDGYFDLSNSSAHSVTFTGAERFDLTLTIRDDVVTTGDGDDVVRGNAGNDHLVTRKGADTIDGGEGADRWTADKSAMTASLDLDLTRTAVQATYVIGGKTATVRGIEDLGNGDADRFQSGSGSDVIITRSEQYDDQIATNAGADTVKVAGGNDVVDLGTNAAGSVDTLIVDYAHLNSGAGVNTGIQTGTLADGYGGYFDLGNSSAHSVVFAGAERFDLTLTVWDDVVTTGDGDDVVRGNGGNDYLVTRKGADIIDGGEGADTWGADKSAMTAALDLDLTRTAVQATYVIGGKTATVRGIEDLGNGDADRFQSGSGNDVIITRSEQYDDQIATNAGADTVKVAGGNDVVDLGTGSDVLIVDYSHLDSGAGVTTGVQTGTLATGYGGYFDLANSSAHSVGFTGAERFDLTLTIRNDAVTTGDGDDVLDGRAGDDTLIGAGGNDTYVVDSQGDRVVETANGGTDTIKSSVTFALEAGQAIEILATTSDTAKTAINLTGNELVNRLRGNAGANVLDGGLGADLMYGLAGNDTYLVDDAADRVYEAAAGGTLDTVKVAANVLRYALLAGQEIESLAAADVAGFAALSLTGNEFGQAITGNAGDNVLKGGLGADALNGKGGVDTADYSDKTTSVAVTLNRNTSAVVTVGGQAEDTVAAIENVIGGSAADMLTGDDLANRLDGGRGADVLKGMAGADTYIVDDAGDQVIEAAAGGTDAVLASVSYTLQAGQEIEGLSTTDDAGLGAINLTGNEFVNALKGNAGRNILNGGGGADTMTGLGGVDTYYVDVAGDRVIEAAGGGTDTVLASATYTLQAGQEIERLYTTDDGGVAAINLTGNEFVNALKGNAGRNILNGGGGADTMTGLGGVDTYYVDVAGDRVIEAAGGGTDTVMASVNFTLEAGQEIERLYTTNDAGTAALRLTGNEFVNALKGNAGSNALNGGGGADVMTGLRGNDTYYVDGAGDRAIEAAGGGTDTVLTSVDYTLETGQEIERLYTTSDAGTGELKLTGNEFVNALKGNAGSNTLNGGGGADTMTGLGGADTFYVNVAGDRVIEAAGGGTDVVLTSVDYALESGQEIERLHTISDAGTEALKLTGNEFANAIRGNAGANVLDGGRGSDTLFGLGGKDVFVFSTAVANNIDNIADFLVVDDSIQLSRSIFGALQIGALDQNAFKDIGITGASVDASDRILYNRQTGALFYDADGSLTGSAAIQFAALDNKALITHADFTVV